MTERMGRFRGRRQSFDASYQKNIKSGFEDKIQFMKGHLMCIGEGVSTLGRCVSLPVN